MKTVRLTTAAGDRALPDRPAHRDRRRRGAAVPGRVRDLRSRQRHRASGSALHEARRRAADVARPERAGDGAGRGRLRQGDATAARSWWRRRRSAPARLNMVTAAGVAHANRLPVLLLAGDTFQSRCPTRCCSRSSTSATRRSRSTTPSAPVTATGTASRARSRSLQSLPLAVRTMLDPADCGPAFLGLPQDVQAEAFDFPDAVLRADGARASPGRGPTAASSPRAVDAAARRRAPLIIAGGGVHYSARRGRARGVRRAPRHARRRDGRRQVAARCRPPAATPGRSASPAADQRQRARRRGRRRPRGRHAPAGLHDRLVDGVRATTPALDRPQRRALRRRQAPRACRWSAMRARRSSSSTRRSAAGGPTRTGSTRAASEAAALPRVRRRHRRPSQRTTGVPTYAQVIGAVNRQPAADDYALDGGRRLPRRAERSAGGRKGVGTFDCEYGFSCMGYEIAGAWGAKMARPRRRGHRVRRRRLVPDDELRPLQLGAVRAQADRDRLRQRRLRRDRPAADRPGRRVVQQHARRRAGAASGCTSTSSRTPRRWAATPSASPTIAELDDAFERARAADRTDRDRDRRRPARAGPRAARSGRSACPRCPIGDEVASRARARARRASAASAVGW